jgi:quinol monooxygenase YgiN
MIVVSGKWWVKPEHRDAWQKWVAYIHNASQNDAGKLSYGMYESSDETNLFLFFEEWESKNLIDAHLETAHFKTFYEAVMPLQASPPEIKLYDANIL